MVVVVQFFPADQQAPRHDVGTGVGAGEIAIAPGMAQAVDHAGGPERNPGHLHRPDREAQDTEQGHVQDQHQAHAQQIVAAVQVAFDPVVGCAVAVAREGLGIAGLVTIEFRPAEEDLGQAEHGGRMGSPSHLA